MSKKYSEVRGNKRSTGKFDKEVAKWEQDASAKQKDIKDLKDSWTSKAFF